MLARAAKWAAAQGLVKKLHRRVPGLATGRHCPFSAFGPNRGFTRGEREGCWKKYASAGAVAALAATLLGGEEQRPVYAQDDELQGKADMFGGVLIETKTLAATAHDFDKQLAAALERWRAAGKKGVWLRLKPDHAALLPTAYRWAHAHARTHARS